MSLTNPKTVVTEERLSEFYTGILPYLGGMPEVLANKFSKSDIYSTSEKMIGQWIDGKPIYQKTVTGVMPNCTTTGTAVTDFLQYSSCGISNVSRVIGAYGFVYNDGTNVYRPFGMQASDGGFVSVIPHSTYADLINAQPGLSGKTAYITLQYTKTTDSAVEIGSDTDYSTTEKIVGTWIDGKPLYQCTYIATAKSDGTLFTFPNTYEICNFFGIVGGGESLNCSYDSSHYVFTSIDPTNHLVFQKVAGYIGQTEYVTLQYTKTTD